MGNIDKAKQAYISGECATIKQAGAKYGIPEGTICGRAKRERWATLRRAARGQDLAVDIMDCATKIAGAEQTYYATADNLLARAYALSKTELSPCNLRTVVSALLDLKEAIGILTPVEAELHRAKIEKLKSESSLNAGAIRLVLGEAEEAAAG